MHAKPDLTETEALKLENLSLEGRYLDSQRMHLDRAVQDWHTKEATVKAAIEQAHPGWEFTPRTGVWTRKGESDASTTH